jgi:hypothetical protein
MKLTQTAAVLGASRLASGFSFTSNPKGKVLRVEITQVCAYDVLNVGSTDVAPASSRRSFLLSAAAAVFASAALPVEPSNAAADCFSDCLKVSYAMCSPIRRILIPDICHFSLLLELQVDCTESEYIHDSCVPKTSNCSIHFSCMYSICIIVVRIHNIAKAIVRTTVRKKIELTDCLVV